ncbi:MAG: hypothetical protein J2O49_05850 [Sciscionella sp.]|nr:hypothetical protein [Sciscionella sp.]
MSTSATRSRLLKAASVGAIVTAALGVASAANAATTQAAPARPDVQFGHFHGHVHHLGHRHGGVDHSFSGGNWGGYASLNGNFSTATASWTEPSVTCRSSNDLFAPWVGIDGDGSQTVEQTGVATDCSSGSPQYSAWYEMYPADPVYWNDPVSAGDKFTGTIQVVSSGQYKLTLVDNTKGWTETTTQSLQASDYSAEAIIESPTDSYPQIDGGVNFSGVQFDGKNLADTNPQALDADDRGSNTFVPGAIGSDGESFNISEQ